jgi:hypothetical protein
MKQSVSSLTHLDIHDTIRIESSALCPTAAIGRVAQCGALFDNFRKNVVLTALNRMLSTVSVSQDMLGQAWAKGGTSWDKKFGRLG